MADQRKGGIAWTDQTWNPIRGCSRVSEGCRNCYAEIIAARFNKPGQPYDGLAVTLHGKAHWTGTVRLIEEHLNDPLRWTKSRRVFVNSMSDLFHESVPDSWIARIFNVMREAEYHVFQVLTKRPARMMEVLSRWNGSPNLSNGSGGWVTKPLPNVWLGVSVEDQETADERIPILLQTPAAVRWVSYEPALGPVDFSGHLCGDHLCVPFGCRKTPCSHGLDWVVIGGESGKDARPFDLAWARQTIDQCRAARVTVFMKQVGSRARVCPMGWEKSEAAGSTATLLIPLLSKNRAGADPAEWPEDLRVREFPE